MALLVFFILAFYDISMFVAFWKRVWQESAISEGCATKSHLFAFLFPRFLTYSYLPAFNARLLLAPITLSYDWQMGSIPLLTTISDIRNLSTIVLAITLATIIWKLIRQMTSFHVEVSIAEKKCEVADVFYSKVDAFDVISYFRVHFESYSLLSLFLAGQSHQMCGVQSLCSHPALHTRVQCFRYGWICGSWESSLYTEVGEKKDILKFVSCSQH